MTKKTKKQPDKDNWATGAGVMIGTGIGFFFMPNVFVFVGCILLGIGTGLLLSAILAKDK